MIPIRYNLRSIAARRLTAAMTALSIALVVMVLLLLMGFVAGARSTMTSAASRNNWIVLQLGVDDESGSGISPEMYKVIRAMPEIAADAKGNPLISEENMLGFDPDPDAPVATTVIMRGVRPIAFEVHRGIHFLSGHPPIRGRGEMIVGVFTDDGSARESEAWVDLDDLISDVRVTQGQWWFNSLHVVMKPGAGEQFRDAVTHDGRLKVHAMSEAEYYASQAHFTDQVRSIGLVVAIVLAIGAIFGGMNTMYTAVARRAREVATLRVLGFGHANVLASFVAESALLGLMGGVAGIVLGLAVADATGLTSKMMKVGTVLFSFRLTPLAFAVALVAAIAIGVIGGFLPSWRAARLSILEALRD